MQDSTSQTSHWCFCPKCQGQGKQSRKVRKGKLQRDMQGSEPWNFLEERQPTYVLQTCKTCKGSGIIAALDQVLVDHVKYPHLSIIGAGIAGVALAVACLHRGIPFSIYEKDFNFDSRSQGYGLTLQQASKAMVCFGIEHLNQGVVSTKHVVHDSQGHVLGQWGMRRWLSDSSVGKSKHSNIHIARQSLRMALMDQLPDISQINWGHELTGYTKLESGRVQLDFKTPGQTITQVTDIVVGADGIRSCVRELLLKEPSDSLDYLGCMVILGICPLNALKDFKHDLLDSKTVFQTANGQDRIYMMPYDCQSIMWQLSFPISQTQARELSQKGPECLKNEALTRAFWHSPIPEVLKATPTQSISGYPVYDRQVAYPEVLKKTDFVTLLGDAAHPMSPFKGQGANQALLDALLLARVLTKACGKTAYGDPNFASGFLVDFEQEMFQRSAAKVRGSALAASVLHSQDVLIKKDSPRTSGFE